MDNTSLRGRFSLSTTNLTTPIAESTCLNGSSSQTKFNWGEGTISPRSRNNSLIGAKNTSISKHLNETPHKVSMSPASRIDPRTYVDIHSNGLASRIVKYHDNSARMNRSLSMGNLYNKPGQFPVVHLKKNDMQHKAKKCRNLSMTRIAAPETSVFHGNTLSSILRSGSIVGLQKSDEEISRENRPILHPPPTENELAPTRSVLEVLKEISRKRINSDELDGTELIKKHCKEPEYGEVPYNGQRAQSKRQREMSSTTASNSQISPEQHAVKKRMCNYNNDIMSSLSSSMLSINKKKMLEMQSQKRNASDLIATSITNVEVESSSARNEKHPRCLSNFDLDHLSQSNKSYTPITPLASTPQQSTGVADVLETTRLGKVTRSSSEPFVGSIKPKLTLFNKDYDQAPTNTTNDIAEGNEDGDLCGIQFVKPKKSSSLSSDGTLLLEKTKKSKLALMLKGLKGELDEEDEVDTKVQPPSKATEVVKASVSIAAASTVPSTQAAISFGIGTASSTKEVTKITPTPDVAAKSVAGISSTTPTVVKSGLQFNVPTTTAAVSSTASNGFKINATTVLANTATTTTVVSAAAVSTTAASSNTTSIPTLGGFSFGLNKPLSLPAATTTAPAITQQSVVQSTTTTTTAASLLPAVVPPTAPAKIEGIKSFGGFGLTSTQAPNSTSIATASTFTFGAPSTLALTQPTTQASTFAPITSTKPSVQPPPTFGQATSAVQPSFTFGALAATNSTSTAAGTSSSLMPTAPGAVHFGSPKPTFGVAGSQAPANPNAGLSGSGFNPPSISNPQATSNTGGFSFSGPSSTSSTETPKPLFGSMIPNTTAPLNSNTTFSFTPNNKPTPTPTNPTSAFTFGSPALQPASSVTTAAQQPMFGSITPANSFSFGAAPAPAAIAPAKTSFSFSATNDKPVVPSSAGGPIMGGFAFNGPTNTSEPNKNMFAAPTAVTAAPAKSVFSFGSSASNPSTAQPPMFGAPPAKPTNLFGAPATTTAQSSPFAFGSSVAPSTTSTAPSTNLFGAATAANNLGPASSSSSGSVFGQQSAAVAPLQQSSTFAFGSSSTNTNAETNKPATGGFVFGSSSSIGSNASKPATDMNKTFVFGDSSTTITPAPAPTSSLFGGGATTNNGNTGATENKLFSFGGASAAPAPSNNTFGGGRQTANQSPAFSFGGAAPASSSPAQNGNLFAPQPQPTGTAPPTMAGTSERPIRKAMRRLHKT